MASRGAARVMQLLRSAAPQPLPECIALPDCPDVETSAVKALTDMANPLQAHESHCREMASRTARSAPIFQRALARHYPMQEPGAVVPHAGICAGGPR
jgi:hypothetical protein